MRITVDKKILPQTATRTNGLKSMELYRQSGYEQDDIVLVSPSGDVPLNLAVDITRVGAIVEAYEYWIEIPDTDLSNNVTTGVSYATYQDENNVTQNRTWAELSELAANQAATDTMRFWQPANNGEFLFEDVELIQEDGYEVFGKSELDKKLNTDYEDTGDPEYVVIETIEYIDQNWRFGGYFDMMHAYLNMREVYLAKGVDENDAWANCTDEEKEVLVRWNQVGLSKSTDILDPGWSEGRQFKELGKKYREFNFNMVTALEKRFTDWYQYLNLVLDASGQTKFDTDFEFDLKEEYIHRMYRQYELGVTNALVDFNQTVLSTYLDSDFYGTIPASTIVSNLEDVLNEKTYPI